MTETEEGKVQLEDRLGALGFTALSKNLKTLKSRKRKMAIAYEFYRYVRPEKVREFNERLYKQSMNEGEYKELAFDHVEVYDKVPPEDVLEKMEEAKGRQCFDFFEIAYIRKVKDPILFGRIEKCTDRFFIAQWDDDVRIEDILDDNEG